jgi:hypothetical protein
VRRNWKWDFCLKTLVCVRLVLFPAFCGVCFGAKEQNRSRGRTRWLATQSIARRDSCPPMSQAATFIQDKSVPARRCGTTTSAPPRIRMMKSAQSAMRLDQQIEAVSICMSRGFFRLSQRSQRSVRAMLFEECCEAANVEVVKRALFITRNYLKSQEERNLLSPFSNTRAITPKLFSYSRPRFFKNPRLGNRNHARHAIFDSSRRTV